MAVTQAAPPTATPGSSEGEQQPAAAAPISRLFARLVDFMAVIGIVMLIAVLSGTIGEPAPETQLDWSWLTVFGGAALSEATLLRWWGRTPGKAAFGMRVTDCAGGRLSWWRAGARALLVWGPLLAVAGPVLRPWQLMMCLGLLAVLAVPALVRPDHRGLHDLLAGSVVTRPASTRPARMRLIGIDLVVLGAAGFLSAYGAYGFSTPLPTWYFSVPLSVRYGGEVQFSFPPGVTRGYIFVAPAMGVPPSCSATSDGRTVSLDPAPSPPPFGESYLPPFADPVRQMLPLYSFEGAPGGQLFTVSCQPAGSDGSYAVGAATAPTRTVGNTLEGVAVGIGVCGLLVILIGRRRARA